jgi:hypothetical protein
LVEQTDSFDELWNHSEKEIFRLQLLNAYWEDTKFKEFQDFLEGKHVDYSKIGGFKDWGVGLTKKRDAGVDVINLHVVDLPLKADLRFTIEFLKISEGNGQRSSFVERKDVRETVRGVQDFYMFDSRVVLPIVYDSKVEGRFLKFGKPITDPQAVSRYIKIRDALVKAAIPMEEFLKRTDTAKSSKQRSRSI